MFWGLANLLKYVQMADTPYLQSGKGRCERAIVMRPACMVYRKSVLVFAGDVDKGVYTCFKSVLLV